MPDVIHLDDVRRICIRCGFDLPISQFPPTSPGRRLSCSACLPGEPLFLRVASLAAVGRLRGDAIAALLGLQLTVAAARILAGERWPRLSQARAMQRSAVIGSIPKQA